MRRSARQKRPVSAPEPAQESPAPKKAKAARTKVAPAVHTKAKAVLVVLPGASGSFSKAMHDLVLSQLSDVVIHNAIDERRRWNTRKAAAPANFELVRSCCPSTADLATYGVDTFYVFAHSFGNRVLCEMLGAGALRDVCGVILSGFPLYGPKNNDERVVQLRLLPATTPALVLSGDADDFLHRPYLDTAGAALLQATLEALAHPAIDVVVLENAGHDLPKTKGKDTAAATATRMIESIASFLTTHRPV
ncbi:hypothetical protein SDRG_08503 [Saprolegnia diclina VS20]|uniref:KANL3/Tex30 alpha/beta hydrolase-like domain-containing protein n=1 Tax=Saprolegnia diclina (strain VS20) TaxID=1156394 RepID=T0QJ95_SAPDV|nr:hypothetical protein SDRG_08503 [Saprolegnia diclina VS20]EQC33820.1 hypothetical protein SDRG_08503 [Saprolegnia diclina VS20]|eukprot:XP_008612615.1 hypothetical protein SDRG_08503 [Saprolegnia diclina VS20]